MTEEQQAAIVAAIREYNAAENSMRRAHAELMAALPPGVEVLHRTPSKTDDDKTVYWTYERPANRESIYTGAIRNERGKKAVIVVAPGPREEFLPRLEAKT